MYDLIIIGGGPAGLAAAIYAARFKLKAVVLSENIGGYLLETHRIDNYPGLKGVSGYELAKKMEEHCKDLGTEIKEENVIDARKNKVFEVTTEKKAYKGKTVLLATGTKRKKLNITGEDKFAGKGVSYCATCDGAFFKDKVIGVVGGGDAAVKSAELLAQYAKKIYLIHRRNELRAEPALVEELKKSGKVEFILNANVVEIKGGKFVNKLKLDNGKELGVEGVFIEIGAIPSPILIKELGVKTDEWGYVIVDAGMKTNVDGVYSAGDITTGSDNFRQIITAAAEGAIAAHSAYNHLNKGG